MVTLPPSPYIESRYDRYCLTGTGISFTDIASMVLWGRTVDEIAAAWPMVDLRGKLEGAIAYIRANQKDLEAYFAEEEARNETLWHTPW